MYWFALSSSPLHVTVAFPLALGHPGLWLSTAPLYREHTAAQLWWCAQTHKLLLQSVSIYKCWWHKIHSCLWNFTTWMLLGWGPTVHKETICKCYYNGLKRSLTNILGSFGLLVFACASLSWNFLHPSALFVLWENTTHLTGKPPCNYFLSC